MKPDRDISMTKEEKQSSLKVQFWNDKQKIDKTSELNKKIERVCKNIDFGK